MSNIAPVAIKAGSKEMLHRLCNDCIPPRILMVVAHPDDEAIGAGARLRHWRDVLTIAYVTDGVPPDVKDATLVGFQTRDEYARARRTELRDALALAAIEPERAVQLAFTDQTVVHHLPELIDALISLVARHEPELLLTHSFEGGHPDHDAIALAVQAAVQRLEDRGLGAPPLFEMASYHMGAEGLRSGEFLPADVPTRRCELSPGEREFKERLFACFPSQQEVLRWFRTDVEAFRVAPSYNFSAPPHAGMLFYEQFQIGMTGEAWRAAAAPVVTELARPG
ncbi:MAG TPA: PIG-L family deacetylase [Verrucomicrobiae bacterium]|jgi:LmbE family N-acetylglucosaminyl deacetylase